MQTIYICREEWPNATLDVSYTIFLLVLDVIIPSVAMAVMYYLVAQALDSNLLRPFKFRMSLRKSQKSFRTRQESFIFMFFQIFRQKHVERNCRIQRADECERCRARTQKLSPQNNQSRQRNPRESERRQSVLGTRNQKPFATVAPEASKETFGAAESGCRSSCCGRRTASNKLEWRG